MVTQRLASRLPVLALVVAAHLAALVLLLILTRTQLVRRIEEAPLFVILLAPIGPTSPARPPRRRAAAATAGVTTAPRTVAPATTFSAPPAGAPAPDWAAEGSAAATRQVEQEERAQRQAAQFGPRQSDAFASRKHQPEFHWDYARTHRIEPLKGGIGVAVNLNDHCALILFGLIPMAGCTVGEIPVRGDLFDHMRDPPEPGAWRER